MASSSQEGNSSVLAVVERSPNERYVRYNKILGKGTAKKVYLGFDRDDGMEVAWSRTELTEETLKNKKQLEGFCAEAYLLKSLDHENIVKCYDSWVDEENKIIHMITEVFTSGDLDCYLSKHELAADYTAIKKWARQILRGLDYLHTHNPPIAHCDIQLNNIFVDGSTSRVKIGDFGLSLIFDEEGGEQNDGTTEMGEDIYSFGLCILQMIFSRAASEVNLLSDPDIDKFITKCMAPLSEVSTAFDLLKDPVFALCVSDTLTASSSLSLREAVANDVAIFLRKKFKLQGRMKDNVSISMAFWIIFYRKVEKIKFVEFSLETDTTLGVMQKLATENGLSTEEITLVSELMEELIKALISSDKPWQTIEMSR